MCKIVSFFKEEDVEDLISYFEILKHSVFF